MGARSLGRRRAASGARAELPSAGGLLARLRLGPPRTQKETPPPPAPKAAMGALAGLSAGWTALALTCGGNARGAGRVVEEVFRLPVEGIEGLQNVTNLQATAPYFFLEGAVLAALAAGASGAFEDVTLAPPDRSRLAAAGAFAPGASVVALAVAWLNAGSVEEATPLLAYSLLTSATVAACIAASCETPKAFVDGRVADASYITELDVPYLERFYKVSIITSLVVGGSFALSPISPLALANSVDPFSQFLRRNFGLFSIALLAPTQCVLAASATDKSLTRPTVRALNLAVAIAIAGIDAVTLYSQGAAAEILQATLPADVARSTDVQSLVAGSSGGIENFVAALGVSGLILAVYLVQALAPSGRA